MSSGPNSGSNARNAYAAGRFALELDDRQAVGFVNKIDGGDFRAETVSSMDGSDVMSRRRPGRPKYEDISLGIGMAHSSSFWKWVKASLENKPERRSGALVGYDFNNRERSRRTFTGALLSEVGFPVLDATSKQPAYLTVKIAPETLTYQNGSGASLVYRQANREDTKQKRWLQQNFGLVLERFRGDTSLRNAKIEAFAVKQKIIDNPVGNRLEVSRELGRLELPTLQVTFNETRLHDWMKWYEEGTVRGNHPRELTTGAIVYYASDNRTELMRLELDGVALLNLEVQGYEAQKEQIARVRATLAMDRMKLVPGVGTA